MQLSDFHYEFPEELIALEPSSKRSSSRLLGYQRRNKKIEHLRFKQIVDRLNPNDLLVVNNSQVLQARFNASKLTGAKLEGLFVGEEGSRPVCWIQGKIKAKDVIYIEGFGRLQVAEKRGKEALLDCPAGDFVGFLKENGLPALPPYIRKERKKKSRQETEQDDYHRYQSVFEKDKVASFSVAASTASFHFDEELILELKKKSISIAEVNLQIGAGTFEPIEREDFQSHQLHTEWVTYDDELLKRVRKCKQNSGRVISVGTTSLRALESIWRRLEKSEENQTFKTDLFIYPPGEFKVVDALITNFHQPRSSLLILIASFVEPESFPIEHHWRKLYSEAIRQRYRLFSFGDAMLIE